MTGTRMAFHGVVVPADVTLSKYGLSRDEWEAILERQDYVCGVCGKVPGSGRLVIDHEHVPGWKHKAPEERVKYVRGICCTVCNHWVLTRYADASKHEKAAAYLRQYEARKQG